MHTFHICPSFSVLGGVCWDLNLVYDSCYKYPTYLFRLEMSSNNLGKVIPYPVCSRSNSTNFILYIEQINKKTYCKFFSFFYLFIYLFFFFFLESDQIFQL